MPTRNNLLFSLLYKAYSRLDVRYVGALLLILPVVLVVVGCKDGDGY